MNQYELRDLVAKYFQQKTLCFVCLCYKQYRPSFLEYIIYIS